MATCAWKPNSCKRIATLVLRQSAAAQQKPRTQQPFVDPTLAINTRAADTVVSLRNDLLSRSIRRASRPSPVYRRWSASAISRSTWISAGHGDSDRSWANRKITSATQLTQPQSYFHTIPANSVGTSHARFALAPSPKVRKTGRPAFEVITEDHDARSHIRLLFTQHKKDGGKPGHHSRQCEEPTEPASWALGNPSRCGQILSNRHRHERVLALEMLQLADSVADPETRRRRG